MKQRLRKVKIIQPRLKELGPGIKPYGASQAVLEVKNLPANAGDIRDMRSIPGLGRSPGGGRGHSISVFLPGESYGQRNPTGYGPQSFKELDTTEAT